MEKIAQSGSPIAQFPVTEEPLFERQGSEGRGSEEQLVIVGSGMAGHQLLKQFRQLNQEREVTVICADTGDFYSKPMLSNALAQKKTPEQLRLQNVEELSERLHARYLPNTRVLAIDRQKRRLITTMGDQYYGQCVLAVGAQPRKIAWQGSGVDQVHAINNWQAYADFRARLQALLQQESLPKKQPQEIRVAIIGAGLVGCEFANDLRNAGVQVLLFSPQAECLFPIFPAQAGEILKKALQAAGIECWMPSTVTHIERVENLGVGDTVAMDNSRAQFCLRGQYFEGGQDIERGQAFEIEAVDLVMSAVGLVSETALAADAGLHTAQGIGVDAYLKTNDEAIFALGDCAEVNGVSLRYILPIMHSAAALAQTLNGTPQAVQFPVMPILLKTPICPMLIAVAASSRSGQWQWQGQDIDWIGLCLDDQDRLVNFVVSGKCMSEKSRLLKLMV